MLTSNCLEPITIFQQDRSDTITVHRHESMPSNSMKKWMTSPDLEENDKYPEISLEGTEIYNLNERDYKQLS